MRLHQSSAYPDGCHWYCGHVNKKKQEKVPKNLCPFMYLKSVSPQLPWCSGYSTRLVVHVEQVSSEFESVGGQKFFEKKALRYREIK
jgi:hypothetical protein